MSKGLGKIILTSSILAGAALGSYMYFKKEGLIDENKTPAENATQIKNKLTADAADFLNRDRSYVDLNDAVEDVKEAAVKVAGEVKEAAAETVKEVKEAATKAAGEAKEAASKVADEAKEAASKAAEETKEAFEPGIKADKIDTADSKTIGSKTSEEFFNDEG